MSNPEALLAELAALKLLANGRDPLFVANATELTRQQVIDLGDANGAPDRALLNRAIREREQRIPLRGDTVESSAHMRRRGTLVTTPDQLARLVNEEFAAQLWAAIQKAAEKAVTPGATPTHGDAA